ncbi:dethiobiotin synthase [Limimaricola cinnabarinus]|jgi:dethiobiotin synthetase|uniref:ATP-dependent dethiobiotin synthetase BioD n=1 Tax=Limimaricola cinnabarinus TaxID=1125964 RepID=A0A2G1MK97_9RHOB|nr:dethiobiotin synthase [Limimaricola cinnabarinus]PHP29176.1 dethiobiotin synthase [Limimaricola cinnabarinus]
MKPIIVTGTDTGIGKTIVSAGLAQALGASYWKPVQSGLEEETDSEIVARLAGSPVLPEAVRLELPASPHISAEAEGVRIDLAALDLPESPRPLVVEGAGGLMVPLDDETTFLDLFARWGAPVVLVARTALGTINHSLLSLSALRARGVPVAGVIFSGEAAPRVERTIAEMGDVAHLGRLGRLDPLTPETLRSGFESIDMAAIRAAMEAA